jgi:hypothetical protein
MKLLNEGVNLEKDFLGHPVLVAVCRGGNVRMAKELLDRGADVNADEGAALRAACEKPLQLDIIALLFKNGADPGLAPSPMLRPIIKIIYQYIEDGASENLDKAIKLFIHYCPSEIDQVVQKMCEKNPGSEIASNLLNWLRRNGFEIKPEGINDAKDEYLGCVAAINQIDIPAVRQQIHQQYEKFSQLRVHRENAFSIEDVERMVRALNARVNQKTYRAHCAKSIPLGMVFDLDRKFYKEHVEKKVIEKVQEKIADIKQAFHFKK